MGVFAQPWCSGPAHFFVGVGASKLPVYFGTTEATPVIEERPEYEPLMNDIGGSRLPFDYSFQGSDAVISGTFTRWKELVLLAMRAVPRQNTTLNNGSLGRSQLGDIGSFMVFEGLAFPLWIVFPYSVKTSMLGMMPGFHFYASVIQSPISHQVGTRPRKVNLTWYAGRVYTPANGGVMAAYDQIIPAGLQVD